MRYRKLLAACLCGVMVLSLAACGGGEVVPVDETQALPNDVIEGSRTHVDNETDAADGTGDMPAIDPLLGTDTGQNHPEENTGEDGEGSDTGDEDPGLSIAPEDAGDLGPSGEPDLTGDDDGESEDDPDVLIDDEDDPGSDDEDSGSGFAVVKPGQSDDGDGDDNGGSSGTVNRPGSSSNSSSTAGYRFQKYVLSGASEGNFVFSGEAIMHTVDMWSEMIVDPDHRTIEKYVARDYLGYEETPSFQLISRIWVDEPLDTGEGAGRLTDMFYYLDMSAETATADKDEWVSSKTDGYITSTPAEFTDKTRLDLMTIPYLSDKWEAGTLPYDNRARAFTNLDGSETRTRMFWDEGLTYWDMGNAKAYCMYLDGGNYVMFILPDEGVALDKINISDLMSGKIESTKAHVAFFAPSFTTESSHTLSLDNFGLPSGKVATNVVSGLPKTFEPVLTQQTKVSITAYGVGPVPDDEGRPGVSVPPTEEDFNDDLDFVRIICNRPFLYYIGDAWNEDIAFFGVMNTLTPDQAIKLDN